MAMHAALEVAHKLVEDVRNDVKLVNNSVVFTVDAMEVLNNTYGSIASRAVVGNEIMKLRRVEREVNMDFMGKHVSRQYKLTLFEAHLLNKLWNRCVKGDGNACSELGGKLDSVDRGESIAGIDDTKYDFCAIAPRYGDGAIIDKYRDLVLHAGLDMYNTYVMITEEGGRRKPLITYGDKLNCLMDLIYRGVLIEVATDEAVLGESMDQGQ